MNEKELNDEIIRRQSVPIALVRLVLNDEPLSPETSLDWHF